MVETFKNPIAAWAIACFGCGVGMILWFVNTSYQLKELLEDEEIDPMMDILLCFTPCVGLIGAPYTLYQFGQRIHRAQLKAGMADAEDKSMMMALGFICCGLGIYVAQSELSKLLPDKAV